MRVLVCFLTGHGVPNLLSVHLYKPDRLVLAMTTDMAGRLEPFREALRRGGLDALAGAGEQVDLGVSQNSANVTRDKLRALWEAERGAEWIVNLNGGTKPMGVGAYQAFADTNAALVYIDAGAPEVLVDLCTDQVIPWPDGEPYRLTVPEFVAAYDPCFIPPSGTAWSETSWWADKWEVARTIALRCPTWNLLPSGGGGADGPPSCEAQEAFCRDPELAEYVACEIELRFSAGKLMQIPRGKKKQFVESVWLEAFVAGLLHRHRPALGIGDVHMRTPQAGVQDEMDVLFVRRNALWVIECKTGGATSGAHHGFLGKLYNRSRRLGALLNQTRLVTTSDKVLEDGSLNRELAARADADRSRILTHHDIRSLAENAGDADCVRTTLLERPAP